MVKDLEAIRGDAKNAIEFRDTASIIEPALGRLVSSNKETADLLADAARSGFFDTHQTKGSIDKLAKSILKTIMERGQ